MCRRHNYSICPITTITPTTPIIPIPQQCHSPLEQTHELHTVELMIRLYCRHKEGNRELCPQCRELLEYASSRLARCPFQDNKPTCRLCKVHCYKPEKREQIRQVMRYAGPRMLLYYPADAIKHMAREIALKMKRKGK